MSALHVPPGNMPDLITNRMRSVLKCTFLGQN